MEIRDEIACPACGEMILSVAKKCKHCGEWRNNISSDSAQVLQREASSPASTVTSEDQVKLIDSQLTTLELTRRKGVDNSLPLEIHLNGEWVGNISTDETVRFSCKSGNCVVELKASSLTKGTKLSKQSFILGVNGAIATVVLESSGPRVLNVVGADGLPITVTYSTHLLAQRTVGGAISPWVIGFAILSAIVIYVVVSNDREKVREFQAAKQLISQKSDAQTAAVGTWTGVQSINGFGGEYRVDYKISEREERFSIQECHMARNMGCEFLDGVHSVQEARYTDTGQTYFYINIDFLCNLVFSSATEGRYICRASAGDPRTVKDIPYRKIQ